MYEIIFIYNFGQIEILWCYRDWCGINILYVFDNFTCWSDFLSKWAIPGQNKRHYGLMQIQGPRNTCVY